MDRFKVILSWIFIFFVMACSLEVCADTAECFKLEKADTDKSAVFRFQLTPAFHDCNYAYSFLGEAGPKNYRANITYAWEGGARVRYKLTGEYLSQLHNYRFSHSSKKRWTHQVAFGGATQLICCLGFLHTFELAGDYSYAYRKNVRSFEYEGEILSRRICGSGAYNVRGGAALSTPCYGLLRGWIGYDSVEYYKEYQDSVKIKGLGGGFMLEQPVWNELYLTLLADIKKPYHFYELQLNWQGSLCGGCWKVGTFTNYTDGRKGLNNDCKIGAQLTYSFGSNITCSEDRCERSCDICSLENWASVPAVYRPVTLVLPDQTISDLIPPEVIGNPPTGLGITVNSNIPPFDFSEFFTGTKLKYTAAQLPSTLTLDAQTGIMTGTTTEEGVFHSSITALNACGEATIHVQITVTSED